MARWSLDPLFLIGVLLALSLGGLAFWKQWSQKGPSQARAEAPSEILRAVVAEFEDSEIEQVLGDPAAEVEIVEVTDYQCAGCRTIHEWSWPVIRPYIEAGTARLRVFPVALPRSTAAVEAALHAGCVLETDERVYPGYVQLLFFAQDRWSHSDSPRQVLRRLVEDAGGVVGPVDACVDSAEARRARLSGAYDLAAAAGLEWVPLLAVEGRVVSGVTENELRDQLRAAIESAD